MQAVAVASSTLVRKGDQTTRVACGALAAAAERAATAALVGELPVRELAQGRDGAVVAQLAERARRAGAGIARLALRHPHQLLEAAALAALRRLGVAFRRRAEGAARFLDPRVGEDALLTVLDLLQLAACGAEVVLREGALDRVVTPRGQNHRHGDHDRQAGGDGYLHVPWDATDPCRHRGGECANARRKPAQLASCPGRAGTEQIQGVRGDAPDGRAQRRDRAGHGGLVAFEQPVGSDRGEPAGPGESDSAERQVGTAGPGQAVEPHLGGHSVGIAELLGREPGLVHRGEHVTGEHDVAAAGGAANAGGQIDQVADDAVAIDPHLAAHHAGAHVGPLSAAARVLRGAILHRRRGQHGVRRAPEDDLERVAHRGGEAAAERIAGREEDPAEHAHHPRAVRIRLGGNPASQAGDVDPQERAARSRHGAGLYRRAL